VELCTAPAKPPENQENRGILRRQAGKAGVTAVTTRVAARGQ